MKTNGHKRSTLYIDLSILYCSTMKLVTQIMKLLGDNRNDPQETNEIIEKITGYKSTTIKRTLRRLRDTNKITSEKFGNELFWELPKTKDIREFNVDESIRKFIDLAKIHDHEILKYLPKNLGGKNKGGGYIWHFKLFLNAMADLQMIDY